ncbi:Altered inheritance of mitochondria protein 18 mitochondrial [Elasticomyces elasticus]|nr:Altered inheritance of mitochondria protein 18 mitochondrial [Elasticomyces elasticus]KAK4985191.1 Altered inheritance of mitochondria protein 18 mitochondrial [Elasticomyces elasticus]
MSSSRTPVRLLNSRLRHLYISPASSPLFRPAALQRSYNAKYTQRHASRYANSSSRAAPPSRYSTASPPLDHDPDAGTDPLTARPQNPLDSISASRQDAERREYHMRRMRFATIGLFVSVLATGLLLYNIDLDDLEQYGEKKKDPAAGKLRLDASRAGEESFQGKPVHIVGAGEGKKITAGGHGEGAEVELVETGTSSVPHFPRTIYLPSSSTTATSPSTLPAAIPNDPSNPQNVQNQEEYTLLGLGIRTVSFLSIQVYVVGLYVRTTDIAALQTSLIRTINPIATTLVPAEQDELRKRLLDPETSQDIWGNLLKDGAVKTAWRIVPTRNTDFAHLRDGWVRGITARTQEATAAAKKAGQSGHEFDDESFGLAVRDFKGLFGGKGSAPKGSIVLLLRDQTGAVDVLFSNGKGKSGEQVERMGRVEDERIARLVWMGYLAGKNVSSEAARKGVVDGCVGFAGRPVGSAETMVT